MFRDSIWAHQYRYSEYEWQKNFVRKQTTQIVFYTDPDAINLVTVDKELKRTELKLDAPEARYFSEL